MHLAEQGLKVLCYPGIVLDETAGEVNGYLFASDNFDAHWDRLDAFEGDEYKRVLTTVKLKDGTTMKAYIYTLKGH